MNIYGILGVMEELDMLGDARLNSTDFLHLLGRASTWCQRTFQSWVLLWKGQLWREGAYLVGQRAIRPLVAHGRVTIFTKSCDVVELVLTHVNIEKYTVHMQPSVCISIHRQRRPRMQSARIWSRQSEE